MTAPTPNSSWKLLESSTSWAASLVLHLSIMLALALTVFSGPREDAVQTIVTGFSSPGKEVSIDTTTELSLEQSSDHDEGNSAGQEQTFLSSTSDVQTDTTPRSNERAQPLELSSFGAATGSLAEEVGALALTASSGITGQGESNKGDGEGKGKGRFFGLDLKGSSVVFVVDASTSMNYPHPGPAKTRFGRVKIELVNAIAKMTENERFFMVFFNDNAIPMPATQLVSATAENQRYYLNWMVTGRAGGKTKPEAALLTALQLRPEVIYFLTDGQFRFRVVEAVTRANRAGVTINTIGFGGDQGEDFLKALAAQNGGVYRFIPDVEQIEEEPVPSNPPKITKLPEFN